MLPKDLERRLNAISAKCRTWQQETGINVLQVAFGFIEWSEPNQSATSFAPLLLLPARLEKRRAREGVEYYVRSTGDPPELNGVLREKLRAEFGLEMPDFDTNVIEEYFALLAKMTPRHLTWRVRRQVALGVFPSEDGDVL